jgi:hypothetical protein
MASPPAVTLICGNGSVTLVAMKIAQMALLCFALAPADFCPAQDAITPTNHIELFNARDFSGWTYCMKNNADPMQTWSVTNGVIHCTGTPAGYLRTKQSYRNYVLTVNGKIEAETGLARRQPVRVTQHGQWPH